LEGGGVCIIVKGRLEKDVAGDAGKSKRDIMECRCALDLWGDGLTRRCKDEDISGGDCVAA
jgi:hypothetical protein